MNKEENEEVIIITKGEIGSIIISAINETISFDNKQQRIDCALDLMKNVYKAIDEITVKVNSDE